MEGISPASAGRVPSGASPAGTCSSSILLFLFSLLLGLNRGERRSCRKLSSRVYVLHPWCIVLVRGGAEVLGLEGPLVENSMGHFLAVLASSAAASWALWLAWSRRPLKRSNKG